MSSLKIVTPLLAVLLCLTVFNAHAQTTLDEIAVPQGFTVEKVADSTLTAYPMFMAFDEQGRLFIAESTGKDLSGQEMIETPECQILRLEDTDGDGVYDTRTVFATDLSLPMGVLWHQGSLFVASPPDFIRLDDTDGDGVSDHREVLLTGWNMFNTASLHGPFLGPDGRLYLTHGRHGYKIESKEGEVFEGLAARIWRCWPDGTELERFTGGGFDNPIELSFTAAGEMIGTMTYFTDPKHGQRDALLHFVKGGVYPKPHSSISEFMHTGPNLMPVMTKFSRIAPSGLERFRSSSFGEDYKDNLFSAQFNPHRVQRHKLIRDGATFRTEDEDFLTSTNPDFYPTDVLEDADGSLLVSDTGAWYVDACPISRVAKPQVKGSIYRIRKNNTKAPDDPWGNKINWDTLSTENLISLLEDPRIRIQDRALQRLIAQGETAVPLLAETLKSNPDAHTRGLALTALRQTKGVKQRTAIREALKDPSLDVRLQAIQAAADSEDIRVLQELTMLMLDASPAELREVFTTLAEYALPTVTSGILIEFEQMEKPVDPFVEHAIIYALLKHNNTEVLHQVLLTPDAGDNARRAALIALDQLSDPDLKAAHAMPLLTSDDTELRRTGLWVASHHADWAGEVLAHVEQELRSPAFAPDESAGIADVLLAYRNAPECQSLIGNLLNGQNSVPNLTNFLLDTIGNASLDQFPEQWSAGIAQSLASATESVRWRALDLIRARGLTQFDTQLDTIIAANTESDLFRLTAMTARAPRLEAFTDTQVAYTLNQMTRDAAPGLRQTASRLLSAANLNAAHKQTLASDYLPEADALVLTSILDVFHGESDEALGMALVAGLDANASFADFVNAGQLEAAFEKFPASVQTKADTLRAQLTKGDAELIERFTRLEAELNQGDVGRGRRIFFGEVAACSTCHAIGDEGGNLGPDLTTIGLVRSGHDLLEAVMFPNSSFVPDYTPYMLETTDDDVYIGMIGHETTEGIVLKTGAGEERYIPRSAIAAMTPSTISVMPEGLESSLTDNQLHDLMAFLRSLNNSQWLLPED